MLRLTPEQLTTLTEWFLPERPGPLIGSHIIQTGNGACLADRWPRPRAVLVESGGNFSLSGDPQALPVEALQSHVKGFVDAGEPFVPLLEAAFPGLKSWQRVIYVQQEPPGTNGQQPDGAVLLRCLAPADSELVRGLSQDVAWIGNTWGGPDGLCASGRAWGAFVDGQLASAACPFFVGYSYEDIGVVTESQYRGRGLSPACARAVCLDIWSRGRQPSWSTSPDNTGSMRVAEKLGFTLQRRDVLYAVNVEIPAAPEPGRLSS